MNTICTACKRIIHAAYQWQPITSSSMRIEEAMLVHAVRWLTPELDLCHEVELIINRRLRAIEKMMVPGDRVCLDMYPTLALMPGFLCEWRIPTTGKMEWLVLSVSEAMKTSVPFS